MTDNHVELREEVRARLAAWIQPTFRHDGDPDPHPDEAALVDRLTDGVVLPYELKLREALAEVEKLRARTREEIERRSYAVTHAKICEEKCDEALAEVEQLRSARTSLDGQVFDAGWYAHAEACASLGWDMREAAWRKYREEMAETLATPADPQPAPTAAELHARFAYPGYEYATTQGPRKKWDQINDPPEGDGWERNIDAGRPGEGWDRFDYHEESYWRRLRPDATCGFPSCGHPEHQAASDSKGGDEQ